MLLFLLIAQPYLLFFCHRGFTSKVVDHKGNVIFNELAKEKFDKIELTDEINQNDLIYYFKGSSARKRFDDFKNGIKHFEKIRLD